MPQHPPAEGQGPPGDADGLPCGRFHIALPNRVDRHLMASRELDRMALPSSRGPGGPAFALETSQDGFEEKDVRSILEVEPHPRLRHGRNKTAALPAFSANDFGGVPDHQRTSRDVLRHDCAGSDQRALSNRHAGENDRARADRRASLHQRALQRPISITLHLALGRNGGWQAIVQEVHVVPDEYFVFNRHALTDESVALDFAARSNLCPLLDFYKRADRGPVADFTTVEVDEGIHADIATELYIGCDSAGVLVRRDQAFISVAGRFRTKGSDEPAVKIPKWTRRGLSEGNEATCTIVNRNRAVAQVGCGI